MEYYFEAEQILENPEENPSLLESIRLRVKDLNEAKTLTAQYRDRFPPGYGLIKFHTHDHLNRKPCKAYDMREILKGTITPME